MSLATLPRGFRMLQPGERVTKDDYLQIGSSYHPVCTPNTCRYNKVFDCGGTGHVVEHGGPFETYWTPRC